MFYNNNVVYKNFCKPFLHDIVFKGTTLAVPFVSLNADTGILSMAPSVGEPIGKVLLTLRTRLYLFPNFNVINYEDFWVEITECIPELLSNGAKIIDRYTKWGYTSGFYDASKTLDMVTMKPNCGYAINYDIYSILDGNVVPLS